MKFNNFSIRAFAAIGALCSGFALPAISHAAGAVSVNGNTACASSATMALTPAGDINITCGASGPPACSVSGTSTIGVNQSVNVQANCSPAATSGYAWTTTGGGPNISGAGGVLTFPTAGTYTYAVAGTNGSGTGALSAPATITVTAASVAPVCTVVGNPNSISAGGSANLTASCTPTATSYAWNSGGGPAIGNTASASVTFPSVGAFTYTVVGSNTVAAGPVSNAVTINVAAGGCSVSATGSFSGNGLKNISIDRGAFVSYALPTYSAPGRTLEILSVQSTASQQDLTSEFSVSECPGNFDTMPAECKTWGIVNQSGTQLYATTNNNPVGGTCTLKLNTQYYVNVRNTKFDRVTPACTPQTCYMILQLNSY